MHIFDSITLIEVLAFLLPFIGAVAIDINTHKRGQSITMKDAAIWSGIWVLCAAVFGGYIYFARGGEAASLYASGYILEKALAIDNLFAFYLIFKSFGLVSKDTAHFQHPILYWGILGAIIGRVFFMGAGAFIVHLSPLVLIAFAAIILWTVYQMWTSGDDDEIDYTKHWSVNLVKRFAKVNPSITSGRFFSHGVTPLFLCLVCVEVCDVVFAFDSLPTVIAVVRDPYLMIAASLWAAAGLRSLYFLLVAAQAKFWALDKAIMLLLVFVAGKLVSNGLGFHFSNVISLAVIATLLTGGTLVSLFVKEPQS